MNAPLPHIATTVRVADLADAHEAARIDSFVHEVGGSLFHRPAWLTAVERGTGQRAIGLIAEKLGQIAGWLPLTCVTSPLFGRALISSGFGVGGGVLAPADGVAERLCRAVEELAVRRSCTTVELRGGAFPADWERRGGRHANFSAPLEKNDEEQLLAIPRKQRADVRKSIAGDLAVSVGTSGRDRAAHYAVYSESVHNLGTPVFPRSLFDGMIDTFGNQADILTVWSGDEPVSSVLSFYHAGVVMPFWGGGVFAARSLKANERMYYELMLHARRRSMTHFDFGRSKTESGPYKYKKNWGFEPEPLTYGVWSAEGEDARDLDPNDAGFAAKIALWKKLPLPVANFIGPVIARGLA